MELGEKIKELRVKREWTQDYLAELLNISAQSVSKWENLVTMPDISLLPKLSEIFGVTIDELFNLTVEQRLSRIENKLDVESKLSNDDFNDIEEFLKSQLDIEEYKYRSTYLLAYLYTHRLMSDSKNINKYAKAAIRLEPNKRDCPWMLGKANNDFCWDWNMNNHTNMINFYKDVVENNKDASLPCFYLISNLIADKRAEEAKHYLERYIQLKPENKVMIASFKAGIKLAEYDENGAEEIIRQMAIDYKDDPHCSFEIAQYYAKKAQYEKAISYYNDSFEKQLLIRKPRYIDELLSIRDIYNILGNKEKEIETFDRIIKCLKEEWNSKEEDSQLKDMIQARNKLL